MLNTRLPKTTPVVGSSWVPEVAQFLIDVAPDILEFGDSLDELFPILMDDDFSADDPDSFDTF